MTTEKSFQLPSSMVAEEFGEINVQYKGPDAHINFTVLMEPTGSRAEGWKTAVALDASSSMCSLYGQGLELGPNGEPPKQLTNQYIIKKWMSLFVKPNGQVKVSATQECKADMIEKGHYIWSQNTIAPVIREITSYLASRLDKEGKTTITYWACGNGQSIEQVGDLSAKECQETVFNGPQQHVFGDKTFLIPILEYFINKFQDAKNSLFIIITDGVIHDLQAVKDLTLRLCQDIATGKRNAVKCVLIGVGEYIDESQMEELDDLETGTNIDIWDHKIAQEMRNLVEIFAEVVDENQIIAPQATIYDQFGKIVRRYNDGLPAKSSFVMSADSKWFELEIMDQRIRQSVVTGN